MNSFILNGPVKTNNEKISCFGIKRQCVEFARRWLHANRGVVYQNVNIAADIWDKVNCYTRVLDGKQISVKNIVNGATQLPKSGDLIIYSEKFMNTGHVSVVINVSETSGSIELHEQNFENQYQLPNQQRNISFVFHKGRYWLLNNYLLGWKSM